MNTEHFSIAASFKALILATFLSLGVQHAHGSETEPDLEIASILPALPNSRAADHSGHEGHSHIHPRINGEVSAKPKLSDIIATDDILDSEVFQPNDWTKPREIELYRHALKRTIKVVYWKDGKYVGEALRQLNRFMRDLHNGRAARMDKKLYDSLWLAQTIVRRTGHKGLIEITSAYRSKQTNDMLRASGYKASKSSLHIQARAVDFRIKGLDNHLLGRLMISFNKGGVGTYLREGNGWIHVDTGTPRAWKG